MLSRRNRIIARCIGRRRYSPKRQRIFRRRLHRAEGSSEDEGLPVCDLNAEGRKDVPPNLPSGLGTVAAANFIAEGTIVRPTAPPRSSPRSSTIWLPGNRFRRSASLWRRIDGLIKWRRRISLPVETIADTLNAGLRSLPAGALQVRNCSVCQ